MTVMINDVHMPLSDAIKYCLFHRNAALLRAHQARHDLAWFAAHDPDEYRMQLLKDPVRIEVALAREYHHHALNLRQLERSIPTQATLF